MFILCARYFVYFDALFSNYIQISPPQHFFDPLCHSIDGWTGVGVKTNLMWERRLFGEGSDNALQCES